MSADCIFCSIVGGQLPATVRYEDERLLAIEDRNPAAPTHLLLITKEHFTSLNTLTDTAAWAAFLPAVQQLAADTDSARGGYRLVINTGENGGQTVGHLHMHFLASRRLTWPPG